MEFKQKIGGTVAQNKRLMMVTKGYVQLTIKYTYFSYIWFTGVKTDKEVISSGVYYCGSVKISLKDF